MPPTAALRNVVKVCSSGLFDDLRAVFFNPVELMALMCGLFFCEARTLESDVVKMIDNGFALGPIVVEATTKLLLGLQVCITGSAAGAVHYIIVNSEVYCSFFSAGHGPFARHASPRSDAVEPAACPLVTAAVLVFRALHSVPQASPESSIVARLLPEGGRWSLHSTRLLC